VSRAALAVRASITQAGAVRRVPVRSGAVSAVGYDPTTNELDIEYTGGDVYRYSMVPPSVHRELLAADSIGAFVNREVKPHYPGREIFDLG
jgi:lysyl-tRNA synthetase class 2